MPSEKILQEKQKHVAALAQQLQGACAGVLISYKGITVAEDTVLRRELREAGVSYAVVKNTMLRFAATEAGMESLCDGLAETTAIATHSDDVIAAAKVLCKCADDFKNKIVIKTGFMDGQVLSAEKVGELGKLPTQQQLIGQLASVLVAPIRGLAVAIDAVAQKESA